MGAPDVDAVRFAIRAPISHGDLEGLSRRVCAILERNPGPVALCEVDGIGADAVVVDALARLQLAARRRGCQVRLLHATRELRDLLEFLGLDDVVPEGP